MILFRARTHLIALPLLGLATLLCHHRAFADAAALDVTTLTAGEAAERLCAGSLSSEQLVSAYLARIKARPELNAFTVLDEAGALQAARAADAARRRGSRCRPLDGVPVVIKDNVHVRGLPTSAGTPALRHFVATDDAPVVARLRAAGAIVLGKTNQHELSFGATGYNPTYQSGADVGVRNPYDAGRIAGGSSSGSAAALGARLALAALGTDTGGSVRVPCAFDGCAALRPTVGRYSQRGIVPLSHTRDTAGPMALSVADLVRLDRVIAGGGAIAPAALARVRLGVVPAFFANLDADTRAVTDAALAKLRAAGVTLVDVELPRVMELDTAVSFPLVCYEAYDDLTAYLATYRTGVDLRQLAAAIASPDVKSEFAEWVLPRQAPSANGDGDVDVKPLYEHVMRVERPALQRLYRDAFARHRLDALVFPTVPRVAPPATPDVSRLDLFKAIIQNTSLGSTAGLPGLQVPSGLGAASGLPVGLEVDGLAGSDRHLLALGLAIEAVLGRLPPPKAK